MEGYFDIASTIENDLSLIAEMGLPTASDHARRILAREESLIDDVLTRPEERFPTFLEELYKETIVVIREALIDRFGLGYYN